MKLSPLLLFFTFTSCAVASSRGGEPEGTTPPPAQKQALQTIQPGDNDLSCKDLLSQMEQMDQIVSYATGGEGASKSLTQALAGTAASQGLGFVPIVGPVLGGLAGVVSAAVGTPGQQQQLQEQNTIVLAQQRKQHLLTLYDQKKCSASPAVQP